MTLGALRAVDAPAPSERHAQTTLRAEALALGPALAILIVSWGIAAHLQAGIAPMLRASLAVVLSQLLPGMIVWRALRPRDGWLLEDVGLGFAVGAAMAVPAQIAAAWSGWNWAAAAIPLLLGGAVLAVSSSRTRVFQARWSPLPWWFGPASLPGLVAAMVTSTELFRAAMNDGSGWSRQHVDMPYELALTAEAAHHFPPHYPQLSSMPLDYHWFANAWVAQIGVSSGTELDVAMFRFVPVIAGVLLPLAIAACSLRLTRLPASAAVAPLLVMLGGDLPIWRAPSSWTPLWPNSVSMTFAALLLCPMLALLTERWRGNVNARSWGVVLLLAIVSGGAKGSVLPVLFAGAAVSVIAMFRLRRPWRRPMLDLATIGASLAFLMVTLFRGNDGSLELTFFKGMVYTTASLPPGSAYPQGWGLVWILLACLLVIVLPWAASFWVLGNRTTRVQPQSWLLIGMGAAGIGGLSLFAGLPANETWFRSTAQIPLAIALSWALVRLASRVPRAAVAVLGSVTFGALAALVITGLVRTTESPSTMSQCLGIASFLSLVSVACGLLWMKSPRVAKAFAPLALIAGACLGVPNWWAAPPARPSTPVSVSAGQVATARYIRDHSDPNAVVMTNRHCTRPDPRFCDPRHYWYAAYSERPMLLEGWSYTSKSTYRPGIPSDHPYATRFWNPPLLQLNDKFFRAPTPRIARQLWQKGVRWALLDRTVTGASSLAPYATLEFSTPTAQAWKLRPPS